MRGCHHSPLISTSHGLIAPFGRLPHGVSSCRRTNNDVEGWHHRLNNRAGRGQIQFYVLHFYTELVFIVCFPLLMLVLCKVENSQEAQVNTLGDLVTLQNFCKV